MLSIQDPTRPDLQTSHFHIDLIFKRRKSGIVKKIHFLLENQSKSNINI